MVSRGPRSERIASEAAAWLARLESTERSASTEEGLKAWLLADDDNRQMFERAIDTWAAIPGAAALSAQCPANDAEQPARQRMAGGRRWLALAASLLLAVLASTWLLADRPTAYATLIGEQQVATLEDGSRIALNADTSLSVRYDDKRRSVVLDKGEAMFEVAHNPGRPFIVEAGGERVTALGTSFIVRRVGDAVVVTLLSGKVRIDKIGGEHDADLAPATILAPGERLTAAPGAPETVTRASAEAATAWRRGQIIFEDTTLAAAIADLGRYGGKPIELADPRLGGLAVSGVFAANDSAEFASAIAELHGLRVVQAGEEIRLSR